jgi:predicted deacylase
MSKSFFIDGIEIKQGERKRVDLDMGRLYDFTEIKLPVEVIRGKKDGPTLFVCSTIHGDEINGIEIVKRLINSKAIKNIKGTLIAIPVVNVFGFNDRSRYLPDRRDLNRCFPGLKKGSLSSQLAYRFTKEIVEKSDYGIDLHTGAFNRKNHSQIRANIYDKTTLELAKAFGAPVIINSNLRDGSLREAVSGLNIPMLLYEGGEALRFDEKVIDLGVKGILSVMRKIGMITVDDQKKSIHHKAHNKLFIAKSSHWIRASNSGIHIAKKKLGMMVNKGDILGEISNPFGERKALVKASESGIIIGKSMLPLANKGDALFHIATTKEPKNTANQIQLYDDLENVDPVNK